MLVRIFSLFLISLLGCTDSLVGPDHFGTSLFEVEGIVVLHEEVEAELALALLWIGNGQDLQVKNTYTSSTFPASFSMGLYEIPDAEAMQKVPDHPTATFAVGRLFIFQDTNKNGRLERGEPIQGSVNESAITYFSDSGTSSIMSQGFKKGFSVMTVIDCPEREEVWLTPQSTKLRIHVEPGLSSFSTDIGCDEEPQDICLESLIALGNPDRDSEEFKIALKNYQDAGCVEVFDEGVEGGGTPGSNNSIIVL